MYQGVIVLYNIFVLFLDKEAQCGKLVHPAIRPTGVVSLWFINFVQQFASQLMLEVDCAFRMVGNSVKSSCRSSFPVRSKICFNYQLNAQFLYSVIYVLH
jgi:hypothetical protein